LQVRVDAVLQRMHRLRQQNWPWRRAYGNNKTSVANQGHRRS
jgi:hypothetical protein